MDSTSTKRKTEGHIKLNKLRLVDPNIVWDEVRPRPIHQSHESSMPVSAAVIDNDEPETEAEPEAKAECVNKQSASEPNGTMPVPTSVKRMRN